ncbi:peptidoglycan-binding domain-containing protein [Caulobacter soli]|uniref:peptidoglycan-binding domain-containing protein n=1 Tax=Caulobacter soli TaxID=2708539 RepID=UPI0013EDCD96|nr:peptidoglycan-binding protein [Caulobacter soli]
MSQYSPNRVTAELAFNGPVQKGAKGFQAKRVQEWLSLHRFGLEIDEDFGPATLLQVKAFQTKFGLQPTGVVDLATHQALTGPLDHAIQLLPPNGGSLTQLIVAHAAQHVAQSPGEAGGDNRGPWVRAYMGWEGKPALWCAGFACFALEQAATALGVQQPIASSQGCDALADRAKHIGKFVSGADVASGAFKKSAIVPGSFFLIRATPTDWTHVGVVNVAGDDSFSTYEGNTRGNNGPTNGSVAVAGARGYDHKDFIVW